MSPCQGLQRAPLIPQTEDSRSYLLVCLEKKIIAMTTDTAQWQSASLWCARSMVQSPKLQKEFWKFDHRKNKRFVASLMSNCKASYQTSKGTRAWNFWRRKIFSRWKADCNPVINYIIKHSLIILAHLSFFLFLPPSLPLFFPILLFKPFPSILLFPCFS